MVEKLNYLGRGRGWEHTYGKPMYFALHHFPFPKMCDAPGVLIILTDVNQSIIRIKRRLARYFGRKPDGWSYFLVGKSPISLVSPN